MRCVRSREQRTVLVEQGQTLLLSDDVAAQYPDALCQVCLESQPPLCRQTRDCCLAVMAVVTWVGLAGHVGLSFLSIHSPAAEHMRR